MPQNFNELNLIEPLSKALHKENYLNATPIQSGAIPHLLLGGDLLGTAETGSGKTAAFLLPTLQQLMKSPKKVLPHTPRALVVVPTRELAQQVTKSIKKYAQFTKISFATIHGGVPYGPQRRALSKGVDFIVATPGRLLDHINESQIKLKNLEFFILDEADRMFDMGFKRDIDRMLVSIPKKRQTILFSATMPPKIATFANKILSKPKRIDVSPKDITAKKVEQKLIFVQKEDRNLALLDILEKPNVFRAIIFTRTKHNAERLCKFLLSKKVKADAIHGDKRQNARIRSLNTFHSGQIRVLVATDIAARGIDVKDVTHVINYHLPDEPENYVHRIGRTARAGEKGLAITLCAKDDLFLLKSLERFIKRKIACYTESPYHQEVLEEKVRNSLEKENPSRRAGKKIRFSKSQKAGPRRSNSRKEKPEEKRKAAGKKIDRKTSFKKKTSGPSRKRSSTKSGAKKQGSKQRTR